MILSSPKACILTVVKANHIDLVGERTGTKDLYYDN
jgi:hypothetical protein